MMPSQRKKTQHLLKRFLPPPPRPSPTRTDVPNHGTPGRNTSSLYSHSLGTWQTSCAFNLCLLTLFFARCLQESIPRVRFLCGPRTLSPATGGACFVALCCLVSPAGGEAYAIRDSCCSLSLPDTGCSLSKRGWNE